MKFTLFCNLILIGKTLYIQKYSQFLRIYNLRVSTNHIIPFIYCLKNINNIKKLNYINNLKNIKSKKHIQTLWKTKTENESNYLLENYYKNETIKTPIKNNSVNTDECLVSWDDGEVEWDHQFLNTIERYTLSYIQHPNAKLLYDKYFDGLYSKNKTSHKIKSNTNSTTNSTNFSNPLINKQT